MITHEDVKAALEAVHVILLEANRTSNFAVPITNEWVVHGGTLGGDIQGGEIYCQVDIHVCADEGEWDRVVFFHGFGDLGMILGLIARNCGFALGTKGLKVCVSIQKNFLTLISGLGSHANAQSSISSILVIFLDSSLFRSVHGPLERGFFNSTCCFRMGS